MGERGLLDQPDVGAAPTNLDEPGPVELKVPPPDSPGPAPSLTPHPHIELAYRVAVGLDYG